MGALWVEPTEIRVSGASMDWRKVHFSGRLHCDGWLLKVRVWATLHTDDSRYPADVYPRIRSVRAAEAVHYNGETCISYGQPLLDTLTPRQVRELEDAALRAAEPSR